MLWERVFRYLDGATVLVCGLCIITLAAKTAEHRVLAAQPVSLVTRPKAEFPRPGTVRTNPKDAQQYVWISPGEFEIGCSPGDNEC